MVEQGAGGDAFDESGERPFHGRASARGAGSLSSAGGVMNPASTRILLTPDTSITCPHCERKFPVADGFARKALEQIEEMSAEALAILRDEERAAAERQAQAMSAEREAAHAKALAETRALTAQTFAPQIDALKERLATSQAKIAALDRREEELLVRERSIEVRVAEAAATRAAELMAGERQSYETLRVQEQARASFKEAELQKTIADMRAQLVEAQRKADQGSQQLQGEVLELAIEEALRRSFPMDVIEEVRKGQRGGDVLQRVVSRTGEAVGMILWEAKRAKDWSPQWIPKLKDDMRACGAAVGILVTTPGAFPKDWPDGAYFALYEDVWVTQASTAAGIAEALRMGMVDLHRQRAVSAGKGEKMEALYAYLTSAQFAQKLKAVYETFKKMREELESEKNVTTQRWARREKQLQAGVTQLLGIGGEIQGLAQQELPLLEMELPETGTDRIES